MFLPLRDVSDVSPPPAGYDPRRRRFSVSSTSYNTQTLCPSRMVLGACSSPACSFTAQSQDDLLTPTDVVEGSGTSAATDSFFTYHAAQPEYSVPSIPSTRRLPADPYGAWSPTLYSHGLEWGVPLLVGSGAISPSVSSRCPPHFRAFSFGHSTRSLYPTNRRAIRVPAVGSKHGLNLELQARAGTEASEPGHERTSVIS
jgi:hypothetical protein